MKWHLVFNNTLIAVGNSLNASNLSKQFVSSHTELTHTQPFVTAISNNWKIKQISSAPFTTHRPMDPAQTLSEDETEEGQNMAL